MSNIDRVNSFSCLRPSSPNGNQLGSIEGHFEVIPVKDDVNVYGYLARFLNKYSCKWGGGIRIKKFTSMEACKEEAKELAQCMEAKNRKAGIGTYGGCKTVLNIDPKDPVARSNACKALANVIIATKGHVLVGGDMNFGGKDLKILKSLVTDQGGNAEEINAVPPLFDNEISIATAYGIVGGILSAQPKKVLLQGVGGVGSKVAELLTKEHGIEVVAFDMFDRSDAVDSPLFSFVKTFEELLKVTGADLFCPCADGHILTKAVVDQLKAVGITSILGAANHQLPEDCDEKYIEDKGIMWYEDSVVNAGGVLRATATHQYIETSYDKIQDFIFSQAKTLKAGVELIKNIRVQYDTKESLDFYSCVMGENTDKGGSIHYGLYKTPETSMKEASINSLRRLLRDMPKGLKVLEIGSGTGFASHIMASEYGHHVTGVNICPMQNQWNREGAEALGCGHLVDVKLMSFERLPVEWSNSFDMVFSQESICHANDKPALIASMFHMLKPGGKLVFSDITAGATQMTFNNVNAVSGLTPAAEYESMLHRCGFHSLEREDYSHFLHTNFAKMLNQIETQLDESVKRVKDFADSLRTRLRSNAIDWNFFWATKRPAPKRVFCSARIDRGWVDKMPGFQISWNNTDKCLTPEELSQCAGFFDGAIVTFKDKPKGLYAPVVATLSSGTEHLKGLDENVEVVNAPEAIAESCAEYVLAMALSANRGLVDVSSKASNATSDWNYRANCEGKTLQNMHVGIVGMGRIGALVATKFNRVGCNNVTYNSRSQKNGIPAKFEQNLDMLLQGSDIVVLCCDLNDSTKGMFDAERIKGMKKGSVLVSVARSPVIDFPALMTALKEDGGVSRVVVDDAPEDFVSWDEGVCQGQLTVTAHIASNTEDSRRDIFHEAFANMATKL